MVDGAFLARMKPTPSWSTRPGRPGGSTGPAEGTHRRDHPGRGAGYYFPGTHPRDHPLVDLPPEVRDRVVYSSHLGGSSGGAFAKAHLTMWTNARHILNGERPTNVVQRAVRRGGGIMIRALRPEDLDQVMQIWLERQPGSPLLSS